jgi:hypothetical protein
MRFRKLRIAWSVLCGIACVLLIVLWVRSYWWYEGISVPLAGKYYLGAASHPGAVGAAIHSNGPLGGWRFKRSDTETWLASVRQDILPNISRVWGTFDIERYGFMVPDWLAIVVVTMLATLPWLPSRFSLRTLLIAATLVAAVLGLVVWAGRK